VSRPGWLVSIVVSTLLLGGCSGDEPSASPPSEAPSTTSTASPPTPTPPSLPASARKPNKAGAVAFAHHFIDVLNYSSLTGRLDALRHASSPNCESCMNITRAIRKVYGGGGQVAGGELAIRNYSLVPAAPRRGWTLAIQVHAKAQIIRATAKSDPKRIGPGRYWVTLDVRPRQSSWVVDLMVKEQ
jgi:Family of unknown function (DUF6318)